MNQPVAETDKGRPFFKASEGGLFGDLRLLKDCPLTEFQFGQGIRVLIRSKVRLEAFPNGLPISV